MQNKKTIQNLNVVSNFVCTVEPDTTETSSQKIT